MDRDPMAGPTASNLALIRRIDELHLELPFAGSRMLRDLLLQAASRSDASM